MIKYGNGVNIYAISCRRGVCDDEGMCLEPMIVIHELTTSSSKLQLTKSFITIYLFK